MLVTPHTLACLPSSPGPAVFPVTSVTSLLHVSLTDYFQVSLIPLLVHSLYNTLYSLHSLLVYCLFSPWFVLHVSHLSPHCHLLSSLSSHRQPFCSPPCFVFSLTVCPVCSLVLFPIISVFTVLFIQIPPLSSV